MMNGFDRAGFLALLAVAAVAPVRARAADAKRRFSCRARLERDSDSKVLRQVQTVVPDGATVTAVDGDWDYDTSPRTLHGMKIDFTAKSVAPDDDKVELTIAFEYHGAKSQAVQDGRTKTMIGTKMTAEDTFVPGREHVYPIDIAGTKHNVIVSVEALPAS